MSSELLYEKINQDSFDQIQSLVERLYELPGALQKSRMGSNYAWSAVSVGKPWYDYENPPEELLRVRAIEKWRVDDETRNLKAGVIKLAFQQIFTGMGRSDQIEFDDNDNDNSRDAGERYDILRVGSANQLVLDALKNQFREEVAVQKRIKISKFASGTSLSSTIKLITPNNIVILPDYSRDFEGILDRFFYQEPVFELEVTDFQPTPEAIDDTIMMLENFISYEESLALQRV
jgi:hypothetical protein